MIGPNTIIIEMRYMNFVQKKKKVMVFVTMTFHYSKGSRSDISKTMISLQSIGSVVDKRRNMCVPRGRYKGEISFKR